MRLFEVDTGSDIVEEAEWLAAHMSNTPPVEASKVARDISMMSPVLAPNLQNQNRKVAGLGSMRNPVVYSLINADQILESFNSNNQRAELVAFLTVCEIEGHKAGCGCLVRGYSSAVLMSKIGEWHERQAVRMFTVVTEADKPEFMAYGNRQVLVAREPERVPAWDSHARHSDNKEAWGGVEWVMDSEESIVLHYPGTNFVTACTAQAMCFADVDDVYLGPLSASLPYNSVLAVKMAVDVTVAYSTEVLQDAAWYKEDDTTWSFRPRNYRPQPAAELHNDILNVLEEQLGDYEYRDPCRVYWNECKVRVTWADVRQLASNACHTAVRLGIGMHLVPDVNGNLKASSNASAASGPDIETDTMFLNALYRAT
eukprot:5078435-Amphidinium_carterae.1